MLTDEGFRIMLVDCQKMASVNDDILRAVESIAKGGISRFSTISTIDTAEVVNNVLLRFCAVYKRINPSNNPISYVLKLVRTEIFRANRSYYNRRKNLCYETDYTEKFQSNKNCRRNDRIESVFASSAPEMGVVRAGCCFG